MLIMAMLILLVIVAFLAFRAPPEDRARFLRAVVAAIRRLEEAATYGRSECQSFRDALRARTRWAPVTPVLVALNATVFILMISGAGALSDQKTLVDWGGNFGPRSTNGEWWRLVTSMFVHSGLLQLLVSVAGLVQIGLLLERLVGRVLVAAVYVAAGVFASLVSLYAYPVAVSAGASGAIFGMYGLLLAVSIRDLLRPSKDLEPDEERIEEPDVRIPVMALKRLGPAAAVFVLYNMANGSVAGAAELTGMVVGLVGGLSLVRGVSDRKPQGRRVAVTMAATVVIAIVSAITLRGISDVKREAEQVVAVENRTASVYRAAIDRLKLGRITVENLAQLIDRSIIPELQAAEVRLKSLRNVPQEHQPLVADAEAYVRLRSESWRLRAQGLRRTTTLPVREAGASDAVSHASWRLRAEAQQKGNLRALGKAENAEQTALKALEKIKPARPQ
jgi:membrane associated rhomboid family serine protease